MQKQMKYTKNCAKIEDMKLLGVKYMIFLINQYFNKLNNQALLIIVSVVAVLFIGLTVVLLYFNSKKKKCRKVLEIIRARIQALKQNDVIKNYSTYDSLKNDQKLGLLVVRWKKSIESLVREIDAQYAMIDVLEDAINRNKFTYFYSLAESIDKDLKEFEAKAYELNDEIGEYINKASDNRRYINKYFDMFNELVVKIHAEKTVFQETVHEIETYVAKIKDEFASCQSLIKASKFDEADETASVVFNHIKMLHRFIDEVPDYLKTTDEVLVIQYKELESIVKHFSDDELDLIDVGIKDKLLETKNKLQGLKANIKLETLDQVKEDVEALEVFLETSIKRLTKEFDCKKYIIQNISYQQDYLAKLEKTAKNFISIFKVVEGSYNIAESDISSIEHFINHIDEIKESIFDIETAYHQKQTSFATLKQQLEATHQELISISKHLDQQIEIIDEIYHDEKEAREKIALLTDKINGTKKYIKYANLSHQANQLKQIKQLNLELSQLYVFLSDFPIDIVKLNQKLELMTNKVEQITKDINNTIYKTLLTEYALLYANRFYTDKQMINEIKAAETLFYHNQYKEAYEKIMLLFDKIDPTIKNTVLENYQDKFAEIFK
jgi:septation ring formation regulator EzrA